ncbi:MAG: MoxR family ATPase [Leptospiraceae bacterium]|nr:MoxR family ATPase [Leptospiraceae bacterium]MCK6380728.1 MoxR family ATPase [Leptospiraceae bacterium]NUM40291.1 MoxR family ATPase [Leptospiraceae bacterium]
MEYKNLSEIQDVLSNIKKEIHKGIIGQDNLIDGLLIALIADGHLLIEGVPGLAKTRAVNLLSKICKVSFKRLQFTPDLLPADIVGTKIYNQSTAKFETSKGPIFANFVLADEINRAPAKVQSALLETMQERQVTIGEETFPVPRPFFVFATQNPVEQEGTYPLPEAQLDRFLMKLIIDYPSKEEEINVVKMIMNEVKLPEIDPIVNATNISEIQNFARKVYIDEKLIRYITDIVFATRFPENSGIDKNIIQYGASPRASINLTISARAKALIEGRENVTPEDIKAIAHNVLRHRIILTYHADADGITTDQIITEILKKIKVP